MVSYLSLSDSKSSQVSRILLSILADLNNAVVWMDITRYLISMSSSPCINLLVTLPRTPITISIAVTFMFHSFSIPKQGPGNDLSFRFISIFLCDQAGIAKFTIRQVLFFSFSFFC